MAQPPVVLKTNCCFCDADISQMHVQCMECRDTAMCVQVTFFYVNIRI